MEAALPEQVKADASRFGLHPALLDAVLHSIVVGGILAESELTRLPFEWEGLALFAVGASRVRARITLVGDDTVAVTLFDNRGALVGRIDSLAVRGISPSRLLMSKVADDRLYGLDWVAFAPSDSHADGSVPDNSTVLRCPTTTEDSETFTDDLHRLLAMVLDRVQRWLSDESHDEDARLVVLTRGAIAVNSSEDVTDLGQAAVWGLLRSAQTENPGAFHWSTSMTGPTPMLRSPKRPAATNRNSRSVMAHALPLGWYAPSDSMALNWSRRAPGDLPPSEKAHWTRATSSCARRPNPTGRWSQARCDWPCATAA